MSKVFLRYGLREKILKIIIIIIIIIIKLSKYKDLEIEIEKAVKIQRPRNQNRECANVGDEGHNDPSCDWSAGTNKKGLGEIHQTNPG